MFLTRVLLFSVKGGSTSLCVNILLLNFQGQQTQSLVGWEEVRGEGEGRPPATNIIWEDQAKHVPCVLQNCFWPPPPLCLWWWWFQANNYSGMELTLLDPTCKAKMNGTHFILESPLSGCGTWHRRSAPDGVIYYNSVSVPQNKAWPFARSFPGVSLKLALKCLWKCAGAYTLGLKKPSVSSQQIGCPLTLSLHSWASQLHGLCGLISVLSRGRRTSPFLVNKIIKRNPKMALKKLLLSLSPTWRKEIKLKKIPYFWSSPEEDSTDSPNDYPL